MPKRRRALSKPHVNDLRQVLPEERGLPNGCCTGEACLVCLVRQSETYVYRHGPAPPGCLLEFGDKILQSGDGVLEFEFSSAAPPAKPSKCRSIQAPEVHNGEKYARDKKYLVY